MGRCAAAPRKKSRSSKLHLLTPVVLLCYPTDFSLCLGIVSYTYLCILLRLSWSWTHFVSCSGQDSMSDIVLISFPLDTFTERPPMSCDGPLRTVNWYPFLSLLSGSLLSEDCSIGNHSGQNWNSSMSLDWSGLIAVLSSLYTTSTFTFDHGQCSRVKWFPHEPVLQLPGQSVFKVLALVWYPRCPQKWEPFNEGVAGRWSVCAFNGK